MSGWHNLSVTQVFCEIIGEKIIMLRVKHKRNPLCLYYRLLNALFVVCHPHCVMMNNYCCDSFVVFVF